MIFNFPRVKFVDTNGICGQLLHLSSEAKEAIESSLTPHIYETALETMDALHSAESALRILQEKHGINLNELRRDVERKNFLRGYYDVR